MTEWEKINRQRQIYIPRHTEAMRRYMEKQIEPVLKMITEKPINQIEINLSEEPIQEGFNRLYMDVGPGFSQAVYNRLTGKMRKDEMTSLWEAEMLKYVRQHLGIKITSITGTSKELAIRIMRELAETDIIPQGIGIEEASRIFQREFKSKYLQTTLARARVIAQTEIMTASNKGSQMGAEGAGAKKKIWQTSGISAPDGNDRHVAYPGLHGQTRNMGEAYDVGGYAGQYPGDPSLPAGEVVNCHCAEVYD